MEKSIVKYGENEIEYSITRKKVKNINLTVTPELQVIVSVNTEVSNDYIQEFMKRKSRWIFNNLKYFKETQYARAKKEYISGESFRYMGRQYRLKVFQSEKNEVKYFQGYINLYVKDKANYELKEKLLINWYRERAKIKYYEVLASVYDQIKNLEIKYPKLRIRSMKTRWGSCLGEKQEVILNIDLIKAPKYCLEYVILHELLHFIYENHDRNFYNLLDVYMPDWKQRKEKLDNEVVKEL